MSAVSAIAAHVELARSPGAFAQAWDDACLAAGLDGAPKRLEFQVTETHYSPGVRARLSFEGSWPGKPRRRYFFMQLFASPEDAEQRLAKALESKAARRTLGPPVFLVRDWCAVVWELPGGPRLRTVRSFMQRKAFRRTLERIGLELDLEQHFELPHLVRYVPRKRAVFRWQLPQGGETLFIKLYEPGGDGLATENLRWLGEREAALDFSTPALRFHLKERRAIFMQGLPGQVLSASIAAGEPGPVAAVGRALCSLHGLAPELQRSWTAADELAALGRAMEDVARALPELEARLTALLEALANRLPAPSRVPVHGNFFGDQVLAHGAPGAPEVGIVDWDDLALGNAEFDIGRLWAHAQLVAWQSPAVGEQQAGTLAEALFEASSSSIRERGRLVWYQAACLLMRAKISALRKLAPGWQGLTRRAVEQAERLLDAR